MGRSSLIFDPWQAATFTTASQGAQVLCWFISLFAFWGVHLTAGICIPDMNILSPVLLAPASILCLRRSQSSQPPSTAAPKQLISGLEGLFARTAETTMHNRGFG